MSSTSLLVAVALAAFALTARAGRPDAAPQACPNTVARVQGASPADLADICTGVAAAVAFLDSHGVRATEPIAIEVTVKMPAEAGPTAAGCYLEAKRKVYIQPFDTFRRAKTWFGVRIDREIFRAMAAHEAAHAVAGCNFKIAHPTIQAKEYIAYVAMFSVMTPKLRAEALRKTPTEGFTSLDRFTLLLYSFDPMRFGSEAWRHFSGLNQKTELIQSILAGTALQD
jgi:hypothetical protein